MKIEKIVKNIRDKSVIIDEADKFFNRNLKTDKQANNQIQVVNQNKSATERIRTTQSPGSDSCTDEIPSPNTHHCLLPRQGLPIHPWSCIKRTVHHDQDDFIINMQKCWLVPTTYVITIQNFLKSS